MRLVIEIPGRSCGAGLNRYNGREMYSSVGRKDLQKKRIHSPKNADAGSDDLTEKLTGKGLDVSTNTVENEDVVDISNSEKSTKSESDEDSSMETNSNSSKEEQVIDDKESTVNNDEESVSNDTESIADGEELAEKVDEATHAAGVKRKFPASFVDSIINQSSKEWSQPKLQRLDSSLMDCPENNDASTSSDVDESDIQPNELLKDKKEDHSLIKIPPTKRKKWPQKACVHCRQKYGIRNDTRYICTLCDIALCKEPCFAVYHYNV